MLPPNDHRWHAFHLNRPADPALPDPVGTITLTQSGPGVLNMSWPRSRRATRFRLLAQVVGVAAEPVPRKTVHNRFATLDGFSPGQRVRVQIIAANQAGEARPSAEAEIVVV